MLFLKASPELSSDSMLKTPRYEREGFLFNGETSKANANIEFTVRIPKNPLSMEPVLVVPGFGGIKPVYGDFRDALAYNLRQPVASFRRPRAEKHVWQSLTADKILHPAKLSPQSVVAMIDFLHDRFGQAVTVVGHSMGGPNAMDGSLRRTDSVKHVIAMGSGGLEEGQNTLRFVQRSKDILAHELLPAAYELAGKQSLKIATESLYYALRNPWRTYGEALDISNRPFMRAELDELRESGVRVDAAQFAEDKFFPLSEATRFTPGVVDGFHVLNNANHIAPITEPERTAAFIGSIITGKASQFAVA